MISIKIKDLLFTYRARLVNILDFNPKKLSIEKVCATNDEQEHIYYIKYGGDPFYLVINDLKGYFKYSKEKNTIELTAEPSSSERNSLEHRKELEFITIIIRSVYRDYYDRFYPQIHLENCIYKKC